MAAFTILLKSLYDIDRLKRLLGCRYTLSDVGHRGPRLLYLYLGHKTQPSPCRQACRSGASA